MVGRKVDAWRAGMAGASIGDSGQPDLSCGGEVPAMRQLPVWERCSVRVDESDTQGQCWHLGVRPG